MPIAPTTSGTSLSWHRTPPGNGASSPPDMSTIAVIWVGRSAYLSRSVRVDILRCTQDFALASATVGSSPVPPSWRLDTTKPPAASTTATATGPHPNLSASSNAAELIASAASSVNVRMERTQPDVEAVQHRAVATWPRLATACPGCGEDTKPRRLFPFRKKAVANAAEKASAPSRLDGGQAAAVAAHRPCPPEGDHEVGAPQDSFQALE
eukprot:CAMPEP_0117550692 /NCGR_PEP_ID=MMETSP0784-20121206/48810_1 /TAXON_ID=39447 /ORGANISM="" /LENGTH=209 /DNA_ID=CAMNT_0005347715 /DNA_START=136 /DNA_END=761 /DNA_ORIENTATION=+